MSSREVKVITFIGWTLSAMALAVTVVEVGRGRGSRPLPLLLDVAEAVHACRRAVGGQPACPPTRPPTRLPARLQSVLKYKVDPNWLEQNSRSPYFSTSLALAAFLTAWQLGGLAHYLLLLRAARAAGRQWSFRRGRISTAAFVFSVLQVGAGAGGVGAALRPPSCGDELCSRLVVVLPPAAHLWGCLCLLGAAFGAGVA